MLAGYTEDNEILDEETCKKMFLLNAEETNISETPEAESISYILTNLKDSALKNMKKRNSKFFNDQIDKIEKFFEDLMK